MRTVVYALLIGTLSLQMLVPLTAAEGPVTFVRRSEAVMLILRSAGANIDLQATAGAQYPDMLDGQWYVPYMLEAMHQGLFQADPVTGLTYPHRSVSRGEFLMMLTKAFNLTTNIPYEYTDVVATDPIAAYAGLSWRYGLMGNTINPNLLQPKMRVTHAEAAAAVQTLLLAEPSLRKANRTIESTSRYSLLNSLKTQLKQTTHQIVSSTALNAVTPQTIKTAMLGMIHTRTNLADQTRNELLSALNDVRAQYHLKPLRTNYYLQLSAQAHAKDMAERGYFSHFTPEGLSYVDRIRQSGYIDSQQCNCEPSFSLGENLAKGQLSVEQVLRDWLNSEHHRKNILRPEFEEIGIGLYEDMWVQNFGRLSVK